MGLGLRSLSSQLQGALFLCIYSINAFNTNPSKAFPIPVEGAPHTHSPNHVKLAASDTRVGISVQRRSRRYPACRPGRNTAQAKAVFDAARRKGEGRASGAEQARRGPAQRSNEASSTIHCTSSRKDRPACAASSGTMEVSVMPGCVLTSSTTSAPVPPGVSS